MGDRALVVFKHIWEKDQGGEGKNDVDYSPAVYVHWQGYKVRDSLALAGPTLRKGDNSYSAARYCGYWHKKLSGNLGLGILPGPTKADARNKFKKYSHGDAGVFVVNVDTGHVEVFAGYEAREPDPEDKQKEWGPFDIELGKG